MNFFILKNNFSGVGPTVTDFLPVDGSKTGQAPRCPACGGFMGMLPLVPPIRVKIEILGTEFGDIAFGPSDDLLISDRFWQLYQAVDLTGLIYVAPAEVMELTLQRKLRKPIPRYHCCRVDGGRAIVDDSESGIERDNPGICGECWVAGIKRLQRVILKPNSWSGEDIFIARGLTGIIMTSEKFKIFCDLNRISNVTLIPAENFSFDQYPWEKEK